MLDVSDVIDATQGDRMSQPAQSQMVLTPLTEAAIFLVARVHPTGDETLLDLFADASGLVKSVGFREQRCELSLVIGIGASIWPRLYRFDPPAGLHPFTALSGDTHSAPSTPGDVLFHIRARRMDLCFELASLITRRLGRHVEIVDEVHGFRYFDSRDLLGFVDGTENPEGADAVHAVYVTDEQDPAYAGGSYVIVQKYVHDMEAWDALSTEEQELAIGRYKLNDVEMPDDVKPANSHVALNTIEDENGEELEIVRDNMPFGRPGSDEYGTYFIGYAADPAITEKMLENMFIGDPPGNHDRILDFSTALTGSLFFVPTIDFLEDPDGAVGTTSVALAGADRAVVPAGTTAGPASTAGAPDADDHDDSPPTDADAIDDTPIPRPPDGSLGIGSLKR